MKSIKLILLATMMITSLVSCKKYLEDAYLDPNRPTSPNVQTMWGPIANNWTRGVFFDSRFVGAYTQNFVSSGINNVWDRMSWDGNISNGTNGGEIWRQHYWQVGSTLRYMFDAGKASQNWDYVGAAYAMFAYSWQTAADQYGELIVNQAFDATRLTFDFESQSEAYKLVFNMQIALLNICKCLAQKLHLRVCCQEMPGCTIAVKTGGCVLPMVLKQEIFIVLAEKQVVIPLIV